MHTKAGMPGFYFSPAFFFPYETEPILIHVKFLRNSYAIRALGLYEFKRDIGSRVYVLNQPYLD